MLYAVFFLKCVFGIRSTQDVPRPERSMPTDDIRWTPKQIEYLQSVNFDTNNLLTITDTKAAVSDDADHHEHWKQAHGYDGFDLRIPYRIKLW